MFDKYKISKNKIKSPKMKKPVFLVLLFFATSVFFVSANLVSAETTAGADSVQSAVNSVASIAELSGALVPSAPAPAVLSRAAVLMDAESGTVLFAHNPHLVIPPASLTKLMTIHLAFQAIKAGRASENDIVELPEETWAGSQPPRSSLMFLGPNQTVTLGEILLGMAVPSGNDAAVAAALHLAPTVEAFVMMMNAEAGRLGLASTRFTEPAGIASDNTTTAMDFARFCAVYIKEHPQSLALLHSVLEFSYPKAINMREGPPETIVQYNRNFLLETFPGVDGIKTGHITEAGYNIALSARRGETRFIAVILGAESEETRNKDGEALLGWAFENFKTTRPAVDVFPTVRVWKSKEKYIALRPAESLVFTAAAARAGVLTIETELVPYVSAPLAEGTAVGELIISDSAGELRRVPLVLEKAAPKGNFFRVLFDAIRMFFAKRFGKQ